MADDQEIVNRKHLAFAFAEPSITSLADSRAISTARFYQAKTLALSFTAGADVKSRQLIYEQAGDVHGLSVFIEGGKFSIAAWNMPEEYWGYKELSVDIRANEFYTAALVLDGTLPADGTLTAYLNGSEVSQVGGVGLLYGQSAISASAACRTVAFFIRKLKAMTDMRSWAPFTSWPTTTQP